MLEFLHSHTNVIYQADFDDAKYGGINAYTLGYKMMTDIRRICEEPTQEDILWFPELAGSNWNESMHFAMKNFKDESFIAQYLSPKLIRELKLFKLVDDDQDETLLISAIHNEEGYHCIRQTLADQYNTGNNEPDIQIYNVDIKGNRTLTLRHSQHNRKPLDETSTSEVLQHMHKLWGFPIVLETVTSHGEVVKSYRYPSEPQ